MDEYRELLGEVDAWYRRVKEAHPDKVPCARGCRDCCLGLFDVTLADRDLLREGMAQADPALRADIERRAEALLAELRSAEPGLEDTLDGWDGDAIDALCERFDRVECPVLGPEGECRLYAWRPLTCRLGGVPVVDRTGEVVHPEGCSKCLLAPGETERLDCDGLRRRERKILKRRHPGRSGATLFITQAVSASSRT